MSMDESTRTRDDTHPALEHLHMVHDDDIKHRPRLIPRRRSLPDILTPHESKPQDGTAITRKLETVPETADIPFAKHIRASLSETTHDVTTESHDAPEMEIHNVHDSAKELNYQPTENISGINHRRSSLPNLVLKYQNQSPESQPLKSKSDGANMLLLYERCTSFTANVNCPPKRRSSLSETVRETSDRPFAKHRRASLSEPTHDVTTESHDAPEMEIHNVQEPPKTLSCQPTEKISRMNHRRSSLPNLVFRGHNRSSKRHPLKSKSDDPTMYLSNVTPLTEHKLDKLRPMENNDYSVPDYKDSDKMCDVFLCYSNEQNCPEVHELLEGLINKQIKFRDYVNDLPPNKSVLSGFEEFLDNCKRIIMVLSPKFLENNLLMFFLNIATYFCIRQDANAMIVVLVNIEMSKLPTYLNMFRCIDTKQQNWLCELLQILTAKGEIMNKSEELTTLDSPPPNMTISERNKDKHKTYGNTEVATNVYSEIIFACQLQQAQMLVYECSQNFSTNEVKLKEGDTLEICNITATGEAKVRNSQGQTGIIPKDLLIPNVYFLPSAAMQLTKSPISKKENSTFKQALKSHGLDVYTVKGDFVETDGCIKVNREDVLYKISEDGELVKVRNCRNETGYIARTFLVQNNG